MKLTINKENICFESDNFEDIEKFYRLVAKDDCQLTIKDGIIETKNDDPDSSRLPIENEWVKHNGGRMPVEGGQKVSVRLRSGKEYMTPHPEFYSWEHYGNDSDIVAYKVI